MLGRKELRNEAWIETVMMMMNLMAWHGIMLLIEYRDR